MMLMCIISLITIFGIDEVKIAIIIYTSSPILYFDDLFRDKHFGNEVGIYFQVDY